jgi:hypothetical protein
MSAALSSIMSLLQGADAAPTSQALAAVTQRQRELGDILQRWNALKDDGLARLNTQLAAAGLPAVTMGAQTK